MEKSPRNAINENNETATRYIRANTWVYPVMVMLCALFTVAVSADYALMQALLARFAENALGIVPDDKKWTVMLKALPPLAIPFVFKEAYRRSPRPLKLCGYFAMLVLSILIAVNLGKAQAILIIKDSLETVYPTESRVNEDILSLFGDDADLSGNSGKSRDEVLQDEISPGTAKYIGRDSFANSLTWYGLSFLLMAFLSTIALIHLCQLNRRRGKLSQAFSFRSQYKQLVRKEQQLSTLKQKVKDLIVNQNRLQRTAQDILVRSYSIGLDYPKILAADLKMYVIDKSSSQRYAFMQTYCLRWFPRVNVEECETRIEVADKSIEALKLQCPDNDTNVTETV
jgi:hypothetical protein